MRKPKVSTESNRETLIAAMKSTDSAAHYLNACLEDGDIRVFLLACRDVAGASGASGKSCVGRGRKPNGGS
jgi:DNA-binding phage protein